MGMMGASVRPTWKAGAQAATTLRRNEMCCDVDAPRRSLLHPVAASGGGACRYCAAASTRGAP
eukprot:scaffold1253_cov430-Prasinococcus_capsulatus_cf.AAC.1